MILAEHMILQDRYEILEHIGAGGMADVYKAKDRKLNRLDAIKVLKEEYAQDATFVSRFKMEAQAAAGLSHPNIVSIYDVIDEGDLHYIVEELVEGITLKSYIVKKGKLDSKEAIGIAIQLAQGIEAAHEQHIIHRDIKPQNVLISKDGKVKVADFGIARAASSQTMSFNVVGSVHYISPEQARGGYSDERSDIYSLGITMFEMVTGKVPFEGDSTVTVALAHLEEPITFPSTYNPDVSPSLERIILKCTEKRPENRYASAADVVADLRKALLNPDDPAISLEGIEGGDEDSSSPTITMTKQEIDLIQTRSKANESKNFSSGSASGGSNGNNQNGRNIPGGGDGTSGGRRRLTGNREDESSQFERLFTILGVIAAIIIVIVVAVFILRLGGLFNSTTPETLAETAAAENAASGNSPADDEPAEETTLSAREVLMPYVVGDTEERAEEKLNDLDLVMQVTYEYSDDYEKGVVIAQTIEEGEVVPRYSRVSVTISDGPDGILLTDLGIEGVTLETAVTLLETKGLKTAVAEEYSDTIDQGNIIYYTPSDRASYGETVTLVVSLGPQPETAFVPLLVGQSQAGAEAMIESAGLLRGTVTEEYSDSAEAGYVISQTLEYGTEVPLETEIDFVVSLGARPVTKQFIGSLEASYPLTVSYGPGAGDAEIQIILRLMQMVNGQAVYTRLTDIRSYTSDTVLDIHLDNIRGADGVTTGVVEIVDLTNNVVLTSYNVTFVETEVYE